MVFYEELKNKIDFIQGSIYHKAVFDCRKLIESTIRNSPDLRMLSRGSRKLIDIDLLYILLRHLSWHHASLLPEFSIDYLNSEHRVPRAAATVMVESCLDIFNPYVSAIQFKDPDDCDRSFLSNLLLATMLSKDETQLMLDTGFGHNFIAVLSDAAHIEQRSRHYNFAPEIQQKLSSLLAELQSELHADPELIHIYHLRISLQKSASIEAEALTSSRLRRLFKILLAVGPFGIERGKLGNILKIDQDATNVSADLILLRQHHCLYMLDQNRNQTDKQKICLSKLGHEIICQPYISQGFQALPRDIRITRFFSLPECMQSYFVKICKDEPSILLLILKRQPERLSPKALQLLATTLMPALGPQELLEFLTQVLQKSQNPWLRKAACDILTRFPEEEQSNRVLEQLIRDDASPMVRRRARDVLRQRSQTLRTIQNE